MNLFQVFAYFSTKNVEFLSIFAINMNKQNIFKFSFFSFAEMAQV